jgi:hypothetical protein
MTKRRTMFLNKRIQQLIDAGLLPESLENLSDLQSEINRDLTDHILSIGKIIEKYINYCNVKTKQKYVYTKCRSKMGHRLHINFDLNLKPEDILINEYCPFFGTKLDYSHCSDRSISKYRYSVDRIDNSKGYIKGNVWVISRLANVMKSDATIGELVTFSLNILKKYNSKI